MKATIRAAKQEDMASVLSLIKELAEFEKAPQEVIVTEQDLLKDGFDYEHFKVNVAELEGKIVGIALFYIGYSTWKGKMVYLDDLVVKEDFRNNGIGRELLQSVISFANQVNARLIKWQVLHWNEKAINFYKRYDITMDNEWVDCKMYQAEITNIANDQ